MPSAKVNPLIAVALLQPCLFSLVGADLASVPLNGVWRFALDADDTGVAKSWFVPSNSQKFVDSIKVPGTSVGAAGFGPASVTRHHEYIGASWFALDVQVPDAAPWKLESSSSASVFLSFGGVMRSMRLWVNGVDAANHSGFMDPFEVDITKITTKSGLGGSKITLVALVDGRCKPNECCQGGCFASIQTGPWSGIWGDVSLVLRSGLSLTRPAVEMTGLTEDHSQATVTVSTSWDDGRFYAGTSLQLSISTVEDSPQNVVNVTHYFTESLSGQLVVTIPQPRLWSTYSPFLYSAELQLLRAGAGGKLEVVDTQLVRFGLRNLTIDGAFFILNGARLFLHGMGDDFGYETEAPPMNKTVYLARLQAYKDYGFNFIRLHTHFEVPLYFEAADELGILISPALPDAVDPASKECQLRTWKAQVSLLRNSPSLMDVNMGNEYYGIPNSGYQERIFPWKEEFYAVAKELSPKMKVIDTDGCCWVHNEINQSTVQTGVDNAPVCSALGTATCARATNDFMTPFFGYTTPLIYPDMYSMHAGGVPCPDNLCSPPKPLISHEMGNFATFPHLAEEIASLSSTNFQVGSQEAQLAQIGSAGLTPNLDQFVQASQSHAYISWKLTVEFLRLSPVISGHQWWLFQDWLGAHNGLVDFKFKPKGGALEAQRIRQFVDPVVILVENGTLWKKETQSPVYASFEHISTALYVSNFAPIALQNCSLNWTVVSKESTIAVGNFLNLPPIPQGTVMSTQSAIGLVSFVLDVGSVPQRFTLNANLSCPGLPQLRTNEWSAWVYPKLAQADPITGRRLQTSYPNDGTTSAGLITYYAMPSIFDRLHDNLLPSVMRPPLTNGSWPVNSTLYLAGGGDLNNSALKEAVSKGATLLVLDAKNKDFWWAPATDLLPVQPSPVLFHSPSWLEVQGAPVALLVHDGAPKGLKDLAGDNGVLDTVFFPAFGPLDGRCKLGQPFGSNAGVRSGSAYNLGGSAVMNKISKQGGVWMRALFAANGAAAGTGTNPFADSAVIFEYPSGLGHVIVSGLDLDLLSCPNGTAFAPHDTFDRWLVSTLVEAASSRVKPGTTYVV